MLYLFLFILSFGLTFGVRHFAIKKSIMDIPNERSSHTTPTPRGGGIAIAITWFVGLMLLYATNAIDAKLFYLLLIGMGISAVSYWDDVYTLSPKIRLVAQSVIALGALMALGGVWTIDFGVIVLEHPLFANIFAFLMIVWFINLYNFLDGIDGYAGAEAIFLSMAGWLLFGGGHFVVLGVAVLGFLVWNWHKAKIFMGDVGSTLLGYNVAVFALYYQGDGHSILIWLTLFGVFWFDATFTLFRRWRNHEKLSQAHRKHAYQRLTQAGWRHDKVVVMFMGVNVLLFGLSWYFTPAIAFTMGLLILIGVNYFIDRLKGFV